MFKIIDIDEGFCRILYKAINDDGKVIYYCLQHDGEQHGGVKPYRCTQEYEPEYVVKLKPSISAISLFEVPKGSSKLEALCRQWILNN